jgi:hypothetical protein
MKNENKELKTTGQLRTMLANAAKGVLNGDLDIDRAMALHKLAKNISESLYSETKIAMFSHEIGMTAPAMGDLPLGSAQDA